MIMHKLLFVGAFAGIAASVPVIYQGNPEAFHAMVRSMMNGDDHATQAAAETDDAGPPRLTTAEPAMLGRKVRVPSDGRGHFAADFKLNGRQVAAMVDTGATVVAMNASTARRIGIVLKPSDFSYSVNTANGATKAAAATIAQMQIGRIYVDKVPAVVLQDTALSGTLIGMSFLKRLSKFEVRDGAMILEQ
jgi:aspartyl protease family protein